MQRSLPSSICATCRLRAAIRDKEWARSRLTPCATRRACSNLSTFHRSPVTSSIPRRNFGAHPIRKQRSSYTREQEVALIEGLYTSGSISKDEWRKSVWMQAGLKLEQTGAGGTKAAVAPEPSLEEQIRRLREWYGGGEVPEQLLDDDELVVYERLFGQPRRIDVPLEEERIGQEWESGIEEAEGEGATAGTGVLREADDGVLEEVEFDEELDDEGNINAPVRKKFRGDQVLAEDIRAAMESQDSDLHTDPLPESGYETFQRTHPLTLVNRFATFPTTLEMPKSAFVEPVNTMLSGISNVHISDTAHRVFGGPGLPYSTSTPARGKTLQQKPIPLDAYQSQMTEIEADVYMSTLMPGVYSAVMSALIESRKRLGTPWAEDLVRKAEAEELRILDAGGGGAGVLAVREMLRAEWERMHEDGRNDESPVALAKADGKLGGAHAPPPTGKATVLTGSDTLKKRASKLLDNTTFVPRLPDYVHTENAKQKGKFDIVIAPHTLWPLREDFLRKTHVQNLWSMLDADGGMLLVLEKGVARGFELVAGARDMLLESRIASPDAPDRARGIDEPVPVPETEDANAAGGRAESHHSVPKEVGMIIAPCTNHAGCPMYQPKGLVKGRRDICAFAQRYHRPNFLQRVFGTKGRNHEDVEFSYLSVMRGRDLRAEQPADSAVTQPIRQDATANDRAFDGYESSLPTATKEEKGADTEVLPFPTLLPHSLSLPRAILPPLKRHGHVIIDVCTPAGTLERWTVPKSFSKQAYRDARKASWGDLWALGAKTRVPRTPAIKKRPDAKDYRDLDVKATSASARRTPRGRGSGSGRQTAGADDEFVLLGLRDGDSSPASPSSSSGRPEFEGGRTRAGKIKGIRDKRDKKATGNGRRRSSRGELD